MHCPVRLHILLCRVLGSVGEFLVTGKEHNLFLTLQERFYFGDTVLPLFESGIPLLRERLKELPDADNVIIAYPDEGAWKRFKYQFGDYQEVVPAALH